MPENTTVEQALEADRAATVAWGQALVERRQTLGGRRFEDGDVLPLDRPQAVRFLVQYDGDFGFLTDLRLRLHRNPSRLLSTGQVRGVMNCVAARPPQAPELAAGGIAAVKAKVPDGYYTIVLDDGSHVTLRVRVWDNARVPGSQRVSFLDGPDNVSSYQGFGTLQADSFRPWRMFAGAGWDRQKLAVEMLIGAAEVGALDDPRQAFALRSGRCWNCGRMLTVPASVHRGVGPDCASQLGLL